MASSDPAQKDGLKVIQAESNYAISNTQLGDNEGVESAVESVDFFVGKFEGKIDIALKRYPKQKKIQSREYERDLKVLQEPHNQHENFIRYYGTVTDDQFTYITTELCRCSVSELFLLETEKKEEYDSIRKDLPDKELLRQTAEGVAFLHGLGHGYIHRNISPDNVLIKDNGPGKTEKRYTVKLTDFRRIKELEQSKDTSHQSQGSIGGSIWTAPECLTVGNKIDKKVDVFILGCFFYYVLTKGKQHPFGPVKDTPLFVMKARLSSEQNEAYKQETWDKRKIKDNGDSMGLIYNMIRFNPSDRKTLQNILLEDAYFKPDEAYNLYNYTNKTKPGLCVIISQEEFPEKKNDLPGYANDTDHLSELFSSFGFDVDIYKNLKAKEMETLMEDLAATKDYTQFYTDIETGKLLQGNQIKERIECLKKLKESKGESFNLNPQQMDELITELKSQENKPGFCARAIQKSFRHYASLVVCILSHGSVATVSGSDDPNYAYVNQLKYSFNSNNCPELEGKPKMFIIQACRGGNNMKATNEAHKWICYINPRHESSGLANLSDMVTLNSTVEQFASYVYPNGSVFIDSLCKALTSSTDKNKHLLEAFQTEVIVNISAVKIDTTSDEEVQQAPEAATSLRKNIYFQKVEETKKGKQFLVYKGSRIVVPKPKEIQCDPMETD